MRHIWGIFFLEKHLKSVLNVRCYVKQPLNLEDLHTLNSLAAAHTNNTFQDGGCDWSPSSFGWLGITDEMFLFLQELR